MAGDPRTGPRPLETDTTLDLIEKLHASRRFRDAQGLFFVEGVRNFVRAVDHDWAVDALLYSDTLLKVPLARKLVRRLRREGIPTARASPEQFRRISHAPRASGVGAVLRQRIVPLHQARPRTGACWLVLRDLRSPGNLGTLIRTSSAVGGAGVILVGGGVDPYDPAVVRATMGSMFRQTVVRTGTRQLADWVRRHRLQVVGASPEANREHFDLRYRAPTLLVLGEERAGLDPELRNLCDELVRIPMAVGVDSLNVSVAGSLLMYEVYRGSRRG